MTPSQNSSPGSAETQACAANPKWAAVINDTLFPMPQRQVRAGVLRAQARIPGTEMIFRDHNSDQDPTIADNSVVDLGVGNVFYSAPSCEPRLVMPCPTPAKMAYVVNDRWEVVVRPDQTGRTIKDLFTVPEDFELLRDLESPADVVIADEAAAPFHDGCIFRTRKVDCTLRIIVNKLPFTEANGVKPRMSGLEIAALVEDNPRKTRVEKITNHGTIPVGLDETIDIKNRDEFKVIRGDVNAGYAPDRIVRELDLLRAGGARVTFIASPTPAVVYHDVPVRSDFPVRATDVLVRVPGGYPSGIIDNAFLPADSPLLNRTPGAEQQVEVFDGRAWKQKSIHPHTGAGIPWNKDKHGFHTYYSALLAWLNKQ